MSDTVIKVVNLGKKYNIGHQAPERYTALRDVIADKAKTFTRNILSPFNKNKPGLSKEEFWALKNISFEVKQGEVIGIIGRNGAGKTTLLKLLSRITEPTTGHFRIKGRVASLLEVGTGFHPELTGRENIFLNGAILGMTRQEIKKKFDEIVAFAEIEKFLDTPVKRYSSGMYVRLAFAVAAHLEPEILLVDEVLAVGDAQFQKKCLGKMGEVAKGGRTVLFVSHNMTAIRILCNRALLLCNGKIVSNESTEETIKKYIGNIQENVFAREWMYENTAPQNETAIFHRIAICDDLGNKLEEIYTDTNFNIEIHFKIKKENAFLGLTIVIYDNENNCVFSSINNREDNWYGKPMPKGRYKTICKIPANFFNNGIFNLTLNIFGKGFTDTLVLSEILKIEIFDSAFLRRDYFGMWAGVVRPDLIWATKAIK